ncbi:MAG: S-layer homology domain-containing protein, partial [Bacilli bacterium]
IDPVLTLFLPNGEVIEEDKGTRGETEKFEVIAEAGTLFVKVNNYYEYFVNGQYQLNVKVSEELDANEPNDQTELAILMKEGSLEGNIGVPTDLDWFTFNLHEDKIAKFTLRDIPLDKKARLILYDEKLNVIKMEQSVGNSEIEIVQKLAKGKYYVRIDGEAFNTSFYTLTYQSIPAANYFFDIANHWAKASIMYFAERNWISGYEDYTFKPNRSITRAEVAVVVSQYLALQPSQTSSTLPDLNEHWAKDAIGSMISAGYLSGYPDGKFYPNQPVTRAEVASLVNRLIAVKQKSEVVTFKDVSANHWAYDSIMNLVAAGIANGYSDQTFRPERVASRAEVISMLKAVGEGR